MTGLTALEAALIALCAVLPFSIALSNVGWGGVLAAMFWTAWRRRGGVLPLAPCVHSAIEIPLWLYFGACLFSVVLGEPNSHGTRAIFRDFHKLWFYYLISGASVWVLSAGGERSLKRILLVFCAGFTLAALLGAGQSLASFFGPGIFVRAHAFVHPVTFGEQMALGLLGTLCFLAKPIPGPGSRAGRRGLLPAAAAMGAALLLSNTRGALLGLALGTLPLLSLTKNSKRWGLTALAVFAMGAVVMEVTAFRIRQSTVVTLLGAGSGRGRQNLRGTLWTVSLNMAADHPATGVGPGNFRAAFNRYYSGPLEGGETDWGTAHNLYLHHLAERGALGLAALLTLLGALFWGAWRRACERPSALNLWALGTACAFLVMNLTETALDVELFWMLVWFIWILAEAEHKRWKTT